MLKYVGLLCLTVFGNCYPVQSQDMYRSTFSILDTVAIQEVQIISSVSEKFQVGSKNETFSAMQSQSIPAGNITNLLSKYAPIYMKSDAGSLASFHIRGTSASHTSVLIGGLDINSLTLGSANASSIPVFLFDNIALTYGSSSATNGSGSLGGSVRLGFKNDYTNGIASEIMASNGSFGEYAAGGKVFIGNGKIESVTRLFYTQKQNNFPFTYGGNYNFETQQYDKVKLKQTNAEAEKKHLIQQLNYKINEKQSLKSFIWLEETWYQVQPTISETSGPNTPNNTYEDQNLYSWVDYNNQLTPFDLHLGAGYVRNNAISNKNTNDAIKTDRLVSEIDIKKDFNTLKIQSGLKYSYIVPTVYAYAEEIKKEESLDVFGSAYYAINKKLKATLNLRQQFVTNFKAPFTPALGMDYRLLLTEHTVTKLTGNIQRSYKVATLNDRYWNQPTFKGNTDIKPEEGMNYEGGISYTYCGNATLETKANYYYMDIDNWLSWVPGALGWNAINNERVISQGVELHSNLKLQTGSINWEWVINYAYNQAIIKEASIGSKLNQQLIYTPKHLGNSFLNMSIRGYQIGLDASYTGKRSHTYDSSEALLEAYFLTNITVGKNIKLNTHSFVLNGQINNLLNVSYQNQYRYAMPGINYNISIIYKFNSIKS